MQTVGELKAFLKRKRVSVILISDDSDEIFLEAYFKSVTALPDTAGARLILDQYKVQKGIADLALGNGFRDILPSSLPVQEWIDRFMFSAAVSPFRLTPPPCQLAINLEGSLNLPACLVSITGSTLRVESRLQAEPGTELVLRGEFPLLLGKDKIRGKVLSVDTKALIHKFSHSFQIDLDLDDLTKKELSGLVSRMGQQITIHPRRIFVVLSHPEIRYLVLETFQNVGHIVRCAISRTSVYEYPKYFSPELVILESRFCTGDNQVLFEKLIETISTSVLIAIIGEPEELGDYLAKFVTHKFKFIPSDFSDYGSILADLPPKEILPGSVELPPAHPLVPLTIVAPATLSRIHPQIGELRSPVLTLNFSLGRLSFPDISKTLGRDPIIKITAVGRTSPLSGSGSPPSPTLTCKYNFYFADLTPAERSQLNFYMAREFLSELSRFGKLPQNLGLGGEAEPISEPPLSDPSLISIVEEKLETSTKPIEIKQPYTLPKGIQAILITIGIGLFIWAAMTLGFKQMETVGDKYSKPFVNFKNQKDLEKQELLPKPGPAPISPFDTATPPSDAPPPADGETTITPSSSSSSEPSSKSGREASSGEGQTP